MRMGISLFFFFVAVRMGGSKPRGAGGGKAFAVKCQWVLSAELVVKERGFATRRESELWAILVFMRCAEHHGEVENHG
ncbi:MAG: hypothetical protein Q7V56_14170 [Gammaproteobacteria bacterium]|nr:hypothetical protein [Gammaproteobacteria bacterium]